MVKKLLLGTKKTCKAKKHQKSKKETFRKEGTSFPEGTRHPQGTIYSDFDAARRAVSEQNGASGRKKTFSAKNGVTLKISKKITKTGREGTR